MIRWLLPLWLAGSVGAALLLSELRWFARRPIDERLRPYIAGGWDRTARGVLSAATFRDVAAPLAAVIGERVARLFGVHEPLGVRLSRIHSPIDATALRVRQVGWSAAVLALGALVSLWLGLPGPVGALVVLGGPLLCFLVQEQQVSRRSEAWQARLLLELPVVSEQVGMLLSAGYSLGRALGRIADRGSGACAQDLARVTRRVRQGLSEAEALREWAELSSVPAVHRLVGVLTLDRETGDLGRLIAEEARTIRREVQRELAEQIERRSQQVWIPVTVATLVPGTLFLIVPFLQAMQLFSNG